MISMHYNSCSKQIGMKFLESKYHRKELLFSHSVVLLSFLKGFTDIVNGVKDFIPYLTQNYTKHNPTSITHHLKWLSLIPGNKNGRRHHFFLQLSKCLKTKFIKIKLTLFLKWLAQRMCNFWIILNEPSVETACPRKLLTPFIEMGWRSLSITSTLAWSTSIHFFEM